MLHLLIVCTLISLNTAATIGNGVIGDPEIECASDKLLMNFNTEQEFEGHVYVKGHYDGERCRVDATLTKFASLSVPFADCGVRRQRSTDPKGLLVSVTVVITFHPRFITMIDKAYNVQCFFMETDKTVTAGLDVSLGRGQGKRIVMMIGGTKGVTNFISEELPNQIRDNIHLDSLQTDVLTQNVPMPSCIYQVLDGGPQGTPVKFATVGQLVYHKWTCESPDDQANQLTNGIYCATVHSCKVNDQSGKEVQLLDENGCAMDKYLIPNIDYTSELTGGQSSMVFKFADQSNLFFHCQIRMTLKDGDVCLRSSDSCPEPARGKRSVDRESKVETTSMNEGEENDVDVYSQSMHVFELDEPLDTPAHEEVDRLNRLSGHLSLSAPSSNQLCLSPVGFGLLVSILVSVLLISILTVAVVCLRGRIPENKIHLDQ